MKLDFYLYDDSFWFKNNTNNECLSNCLFELEQVISHISEKRERILINDAIYSKEIIPGNLLINWLYPENDNDEMHEERKLMALLLRQGISIDLIESQNAINQIINELPIDFTALVYLYEIKRSSLHVRSHPQWIDAHRFYLSKSKSIADFILGLEPCFPNLFFHESIPEILKTLSAPLQDFSAEIVRHLAALNDFASDLFSQYHHEGDRQVLARFKSATGVNCSPEGNPDSARERLSFSFPTDCLSNETVICSPHTKLNRLGDSGNTSYRYDRIYFHWGKPNIQKGKILIAHIGQHL